MFSAAEYHDISWRTNKIVSLFHFQFVIEYEYLFVFQETLLVLMPRQQQHSVAQRSTSTIITVALSSIALVSLQQARQVNI
jgi:hypothetical protein